MAVQEKKAAQADLKGKLDDALERAKAQRQQDIDARLLLNVDDLRDLGIRLGRTAMWDMVRRKLFPAPIKLAGKNLWVRSEVMAWLEARMAERHVA
jgi:hypothetical protein